MARIVMGLLSLVLLLVDQDAHGRRPTAIIHPAWERQMITSTTSIPSSLPSE